MDTNDKKPAEATNSGEAKKPSNDKHFRYGNRGRNRNRQNPNNANQNSAAGQTQSKEPNVSGSAKPFVKNNSGSVQKNTSAPASDGTQKNTSAPQKPSAGSSFKNVPAASAGNAAKSPVSPTSDNAQNRAPANGQQQDGQKQQNRNPRFQKNRRKPYPKPEGQSASEAPSQENRGFQKKTYNENRPAQGGKKPYDGRYTNDGRRDMRNTADTAAENISGISKIRADKTSAEENPASEAMSDGYISKILESAESVEKSEADADEIPVSIAADDDAETVDAKAPDINGNAKIADTAEETARDELVEIIGVKFKQSGKVYYFSPAGLKVESGSNVIVETARGIEYGNAAIGNKFVELREIVPPLRNAIRNATPEDDAHYAENAEKEKKAFEVCNEKIEKHKLEMKLINVEYTFDNNKLLFYFTAESRIDFRDLVKDLASVFRTRIELRQIGIRDEAKMIGGLGLCGRPFCCKAFLNDFVQVSIKMAKEQNMSLNSAKISGACGRLMCCLRYEYDTYDEELRRTPKLDSIVQTSEGDGVVVEVTPLLGTIKVKMLKNPDAPFKTFNRDEVKVKGYAKTERRNHSNDDARELKILEDK